MKEKRKTKLLTKLFTANETIANLMQYELPQEESDLLKARVYFSI